MVGGSGTLLAQWGNANTNTTQIPWLAGFTDSDGGYTTNGSLSAAQVKARQIAANIVDFFTTDSVPTSDVDNSNWFTTTPAYIGLKKSPLLYGYGGKLDLAVTQDSEKIADSDEYTHKLTFTPSFTQGVYICNFFDFKTGSWSLDTLKIGVLGDIKIYYSASNGTESKTGHATIHIDTHSGEEPNNDYSSYGWLASIMAALFDSSRKEKGSYVAEFTKKTGSNAEISFETPTANDYESYTIEVTKVELSNLKIGLQFRGTWVDFAIIDQNSDGFADKAFGSGVTSNNGSTKSFSLGLALRVSDPRHNLFSSLWHGKVSTTTTFKDVANSITIPLPAKCDISSDPLPDHPGNANPYIPQAAISSPWEIGQIHRGNSWQTINLKEYNVSPLYGGAYSSGDANLLNQLRMTSDTFSYGKIPLNEIQDPEKYNALIQILRRNATTNNSTPDATGTNNFLKDGSDKVKVDLGISAFFDLKSSSPYYFSNRTELAKLLVYSTDYSYSQGLFTTVPSSDAAKEELFSKCVMLFDTEPTFLPRRVYVFGIAQTIKDIGAVSPNTITVYKSWNSDGSLTNSSNNSNNGRYAAGYRTGISSGIDVAGRPNLSGTIAAQIGRYDNGADKILSEQKVFAILEREYTLQPYSSTNRPIWKIVRFEYVQ